MSDRSSPSESHESSPPDEARTAKIDFGRPQASPPNTPWSAPQEQTTDPLPVGWGVPSPEAGWTPLPGGAWSPPPRQEATWSAPPPPDAVSAPPHPSPDGAPRRHRFARVAVSALLLGAAVLLGAVIAHQFWPAPNATVSQVRPGGVSGPGSSNGFPFGIGGGSGSGSSGSFPFGGGGASSGGSTSSASGAPKDVGSIASKVDPALVDINVTLGVGDQSAQGSATGIVLNSSGLVLTNNHVIDGATAISATDLGNGRSYTATVVGYDPTQDVALIQLQGASGLTTAQLGDSSTVTVHQAVVAIGNAGGLGGAPSAAGGSIVALGQQITARDALDGTSERLSGLIRTNADIQPGDSGGPLVNTAGQVIGLDTAASDGYSFGFSQTPQSQGFAIPVDTAATLVAQIEDHDASATVHVGPTAFLGVGLQAAAQDGLSGGSGSSSSGVTISGVVPGTPAARAGLTAGATIVSVDGQPVASPNALTALIGGHKPGDKVTIGWSSPSGARHSSAVQLASGPAH